METVLSMQITFLKSLGPQKVWHTKFARVLAHSHSWHCVFLLTVPSCCCFFVFFCVFFLAVSVLYNHYWILRRDHSCKSWRQGIERITCRKFWELWGLWKNKVTQTWDGKRERLTSRHNYGRRHLSPLIPLQNLKDTGIHTNVGMHTPMQACLHTHTRWHAHTHRHADTHMRRTSDLSHIYVPCTALALPGTDLP